MVTFDYNAMHDDELTIRVGQVIKNLRNDEEGWLEGELLGKVGVFPANFVQMRKAVPEECSPPPEIKQGLLLCFLCTRTLHPLTQLMHGSVVYTV